LEHNSIIHEFSLGVNTNENAGILTEVYVGFPDGTGVFGGGFIPPDWWISYERPWYVLGAQNPGRPMVTSPFVDAGTGQLAMAAVHTVNTNNADAGVVAIDMQLTTVANFIEEADVGDTMSLMVTPTGYILMHSNPELAPTDDGEFRNIQNVDGGGLSGMWDNVMGGSLSYHGRGGVYLTAPLITGWYVITFTPTNMLRDNLPLIASLVIILLVAISILFAYTKRMITKPLRVFDEYMREAATTGNIVLKPGELAVLEQYKGRRDEVGTLFGSYAELIDYMDDVRRRSLKALPNKPPQSGSCRFPFKKSPTRQKPTQGWPEKPPSLQRPSKATPKRAAGRWTKWSSPKHRLL